MSKEHNYWKTFTNEVSLLAYLYKKLFVPCAFNYCACIKVLFEAIPLLWQEGSCFVGVPPKIKETTKNSIKQNMSLHIISYRLMNLEQRMNEILVFFLNCNLDRKWLDFVLVFNLFRKCQWQMNHISGEFMRSAILCSNVKSLRNGSRISHHYMMHLITVYSVYSAHFSSREKVFLNIAPLVEM